MGSKLEGAEKFRQLLKDLGMDCQKIQVQIVNDQANACLAEAKKKTPTGNYSKDLYVDTKNKRIRYVSFEKSDGKRVTFRIKHIKRGGTLKRGWYVVSGKYLAREGKAQAETVNNVPYAIYVNNGHRIVNKKRETVGWKDGKFMLEAGVKAAEDVGERKFSQRIEEVKRKYGM